MYYLLTLLKPGTPVTGPRLTAVNAYLTAVHMQNRGRVYGDDYVFVPADDTTPPFGTVN